ncbi:PilN domain-containing protein [Methylocapsa palsarum]|uniref:General secretion pathway protein L n=1 Tax=Methylocapsa palsarum TaxID=1612308 RepID=A0A1I4CAK4_9HYPH|nr:PilN domain-containing protein [Methylocapsa palsarum]SFK77985.1 general secretion pathway protein L [Methylocapsa palsarum]
MNVYQKGLEIFDRWIDGVAATYLNGLALFRAERVARLTERPDGAFDCEWSAAGEAAAAAPEPISILPEQLAAPLTSELAEKFRGTRVDLCLRSDRFMFRPLALPSRASDFIEGIVRAQIDRLTPWSGRDAAFGWRPSAEAGNDRMVVTIAATAKSVITPFVDALLGLGAKSVIVFAPSPDDGSMIKVFEHSAMKALETHRVRRVLVGALAGAGALCGVAVAVSGVVGGDLQNRRDSLTSSIAAARAQMPGRDRTSAAAVELERRKHETPSSVIVYENVSQILPDDTYLTEMRIVGDKVQLIGVTTDAPSLVRLIEKSPRFTKATFFAPTTRSPNESLEHFFIEAHIQPNVDTPAEPRPPSNF